MSYLSIGDVAERAGLAPSAIRFYEETGVLPPAERRNGRRRYDPSVVQQLQAIAIAKQAGFTVAELRTLFSAAADGEAPSVVWQQFAERKLGEVELLIQRAERMRALLEEGLRCGCLTLEQCTVLGPGGGGERAPGG